jgi:hypothetical protein
MTTIKLSERAPAGRLLGARALALPIRDEIESSLDAGSTVTIDFLGTNPTQSFVDELVGVLILHRGPSVLERLLLVNCSEDIKAILHFVVSDRLDEHERSQTGFDDDNDT